MTADPRTAIGADEATKGDVVLVKARPNYRAIIEHDHFGRLTVRPLAGQPVTLRARAIWRSSILKVETNDR